MTKSDHAQSKSKYFASEVEKMNGSTLLTPARKQVRSILNLFGVLILFRMVTKVLISPRWMTSSIKITLEKHLSLTIRNETVMRKAGLSMIWWFLGDSQQSSLEFIIHKVLILEFLKYVTGLSLYNQLQSFASLELNLRDLGKRWRVCAELHSIQDLLF